MGFLKYSVLALKILKWVTLASFGVFALATSLGIKHERDKSLLMAHADAQEFPGRSP